MRTDFVMPVTFFPDTCAFEGEGVPSIPMDTIRRVVGDHTAAYFNASTHEVWERFNGAGTTETSQCLYWPDIKLCPRTWAKEFQTKS